MSFFCILVCITMFSVITGGFAANQTVVFEDDFSAERLDAAWHTVSGNWKLQDGTLVNSAGRGGRLIVGDSDWHNYVIETKFRTRQAGRKPWSVARILFRYRDAQTHYYALLHTDGKLELGKNESGEHRPGLAVASNVADPAEYSTLRIKVAGGAIALQVNGDEEIEYTDPDPIPSGKVAIGAFQNSQVQFDSFGVYGDALARRISRRHNAAEDLLQNAGYEPSAKGNIAILQDADAPRRNSTPSDPQYLQRMLREAGYGVTLLTPQQMANRYVLSSDQFDAVILPYGAAFPRVAMDAFTKFLLNGGAFLSMGGYFADNLYSENGAEAPQNLIDNPGFEDDLSEWNPSDPHNSGVISEAGDQYAHSGESSALLRVAPSAHVSFYSLLQRIEPAEDDALTVEAWIRTEKVTDGAGAYIAVDYLKEDGTRIDWSQSQQRKGTGDWSRLQFIAEPPPKTAYMELKLILHGHGRAWFDDVRIEPAGSTMRGLNTRHGDIHGPGNSLAVSPRQIGAFAANYPLEHVAKLVPADNQNIVPESYTSEGKFTGYSSSGLFAGNGNPVRAVTHARPIDLIEAYDATGRRRGAAGTLIRNYRGIYAGSDWAVFGVNNADLFAPDAAHSGQILRQAIAALLNRTYIAEAGAEYACYRPGQKVSLQALIANYADTERTVRVHFTVLSGAERETPVHEETVEINVARHSTEYATTRWSVDTFGSDFYTVRAKLENVDTASAVMKGGFVVWNDDVVQRGPRLSVDDGYLSRNGENAFLSGTGESGYPYYAQSEGPLVWDRQFQLMRDMGLRYYRCMHFFNCYPSDQPLETLDDLPAEQLRRLDALVYLAHKHDLMFLFVCNVGLQLAKEHPEKLAGRMRALRLLAERYRNCGAFIFNMDHQEFIRRNNPRADKAFRRFLQQKYGSYQRFAAAWEREPDESFKDIACDARAVQKKPYNSAQALDMAQFLRSYREAWRQNAADAVHAGNPQTIFDQDASLYWWPDFAWPQKDTIGKLDMATAHFYGTAAEFPLQLKRRDMQIIGKPNGLTEYGILTHPAWEGHRDVRLTKEGAEQYFMMATHYCFGLGGTMLSNWNWKEMKECIFPWSIAYHDLMPKPHLRAYRNAAMLFNGTSPVYRTPEVFIVVPGSHLETSRCHIVDDAVRDAIRRLLGADVRFGLIGEKYLQHLPANARALYYPVPYCPSDGVIDRLLEFAENGGCLYFSGDISFDSDARQHTKANRLRQLAGVQFVERNYGLRQARRNSGEAAVKVTPDVARVLIDGDDGARLLHHRRGDGHVLFAPEPVELTGNDLIVPPEAARQISGRTERIANLQSMDSGLRAYSLMLALSGAELLPVKPRDRQLHTFSIDIADGGVVYVLYNAADEPHPATIKHDSRSVTWQIAAGRPGLVQFDERGKIAAVEAQGAVDVDGQRLASMKGHFIIRALDGRGLAAEAQQILAAAIGTGELTLQGMNIDGPIVQQGRFHGGNWQMLQRHNQDSDDGITVQVPETLRSIVSIISPRNAMETAAEKAEKLL